MKSTHFTESTTSGSVATVATPVGKTQTRGKGIYPNEKGGNLLTGKKTNKKFPNTVKESQEQGVAEAIGPDVMRHQGDKTIKIVKRAGKPIGEIGIDAEASPGNGSYYVKMYDGSYDAAGFETAEEALAELKDIIKQTMSEEAKFKVLIRRELKKREQQSQQGVAEGSGETKVGIEAYGVRGVNSNKWKKTFKSQEAFEKWLDQNEGNVEVSGTREVNLNDMFKESMKEAKLDEEDVIIVPGQGNRIKPGFIPKNKDRTDHEVEMAKSDLFQSNKNAKKIYELIKDIPESVGIEGWVQEKIIKANDYLNTVREYLEHKQVGEVNEMFADRGAGHDPEKETKADREYVKRLKNRNMPAKPKPDSTKNKEQKGVAEGEENKSSAYQAGFSDGKRGSSDPRASSKYGSSSNDYTAGYRDGLKHEEQARKDRSEKYRANIAPYVKMSDDELTQLHDKLTQRYNEILAASKKGMATPAMKQEFKELYDMFQTIHQAKFQKMNTQQQGVAEGEDQTIAMIKNYERELKKYKRFNANGAHDVQIKSLEKIIASLKAKQGMAEGYRIVPSIDREKYQERQGLEGPFRARNGKVYYYDPKAGLAYDPDTDFYIDYDDLRMMDREMSEGVDDKKYPLVKYTSRYDDKTWKYVVVRWEKSDSTDGWQGKIVDSYPDEKTAKAKANQMNKKEGVAEGVDDTKKKISKYEELALAANRAGDDEKCKLYQRKIQALKQKMTQNVDEGIVGKVLGGAALLAALWGIGQNEANKAYSNSPQLQTLIKYHQMATQQNDQAKIQELERRIENHKTRLSLGKGEVMGSDDKPIVPNFESSIMKGIQNEANKIPDKCPKCNGKLVAESELNEEGNKDACYHKVKSRYKVWPSAYASGALVKCRKVGASNWGNKSK